MNITSFPRVPGARHRRKRVGRGIGSGHGKTSTRGQKGQRARTGEGKRPGFEGGRTPLIRQIPKRGFRRKATGHDPVRVHVNVQQLNRFPDGTRVTPQVLDEARLIKDGSARVKLLGEGELSKRLTIAVHKASASAKTKVEQAGGTLELISNQAPRRKTQDPRPQPST
ncbi:MAG TPA: 50S ribosomal protein L15 [Candidatus Omnitrophica bacterium]|nr:MAG: 50S ribosomal protein L15 [Omnitrophica WOR_2 bacterium GWA2_63_20]OGX16772.1 MAG: 50S ribosomal protein L15 [Omnitrophica WOR_2 bacterium GWF2_63_9]OGX32182.1 MAG: 50S ribosomal protein L15 [Omnitrophica WOR_2 bacterium RIFCSPHIGHO2_12_FULL_64_13]OGX36669.1 MAG: 50S ribosomal protein L15 [Omnitrophica WOR_2 bacterium RIFCSPHIGHO2_02_FULL_63_39]OGX45029.1 MAG: 50S ribosomal protein L15 [Omnitrophica WOR_2 bacterium RIFCSPLOWO2_02_FULL_63_16]OGX49997.1 MAG: 50S ribosomal protein L15 [Om